MDGIKFLIEAWGAYKRALQTNNPQYVGITIRGVPQISFYVATGREAWRISSIAVEQFQSIRES